MTSPVPEDKLRLGGMALRNGLLVHGPTHWAAAVRTDAGELKVASGRKPDLGGRASERLPGIRGVVKLAEAMAVIPLVKRALPEARLPMQDLRTLGAMGAAALGGQAIRTAGARPSAARAAGERRPRTAGREEGADAADADKEHDRCGSHLVAPMLTAAAVGNVALRRAGLRGPAADAAVGLGSAAVAVEVFAWGERHPDSALTRMLRRPGFEIQRVIGTREPTAEQLEVGKAALAEILRVEGGE
jgi:uncharacterized protein YqhQ